jgi:putative transposase
VQSQSKTELSAMAEVADHVHLLLSMPMGKAISSIKSGSSAWIHQTFRELRNFGWQQGYGAFSVSVSQLPEAISYIDHQVEPHRTRTFQEEYLAFLKAHDVKFDEKYLWD